MLALITLQQLKDHLGISGSSEDTKLTNIVNAVDTFVQTYTHRNLELASYSDIIMDGTGTNALILDDFPLDSVWSIFENNELIEEVDYDDRTESGTAGYWIADYSNSIIYNSDCWGRGRGILKVSYSAGYNPIPSDLYLACLRIGEYFYSTHGRTGVVSEGLGSYSYRLSNDLASMGGFLTIPDIVVVNILNRYRKSMINYTY
jgi:hypothetical protein